MLEHHSNIVPWQMIAERTGAEIDVAPLTEDGRIDLDAMAAMLTERHRIVALAHVSNVLGSVLDAKRAARAGPRRRRPASARRLPGGAANAGRRRRHRLRFLRLLGPQVLRPDRHRHPVGPARAARGDAALAGRRSDDRQGQLRAHHLSRRRRRGSRREPRMSSECSGSRRRSPMSKGSGSRRSARMKRPWCARPATPCRRSTASACSGRRIRPESSASRSKGCIRTISAPYWTRAGWRSAPGHHCAQPLMAHLGVDATARASFGVYNGRQDVEALVRGIERVTRIFG